MNFSEHHRYIYHNISMSCRIDELSEEHQVTIVRLVNHLASMPDGYCQHAMKRVEKISTENPWVDNIEGFEKLPLEEVAQ